MSYDPLIVANAFINKTVQARFSNIDLQKLTYLAHGTYLSITGEPLIDGGFQAWDYGPVSPKLYHELKGNGRKCLNDSLDHETEDCDFKDDEDARKAIDLVFDFFGDFTSAQLVAFTHKEDSPWRNVYKPGVKGVSIPDEEIKKYFDRFKVA